AITLPLNHSRSPAHQFSPKAVPLQGSARWSARAVPHTSTGLYVYDLPHPSPSPRKSGGAGVGCLLSLSLGLCATDRRVDGRSRSQLRARFSNQLWAHILHLP